MLGAITGILGAVVPLIDKVIDKTVDDKSAAAKLKADLAATLVQNSHEINVAASDIVRSEAESEHKLTSQWRPITMLTFVFIVFHNHVITPYLKAFWDIDLVLPMPDQLWGLLELGIGGYIAARSAEKGIKIWKG